MAFWFCTECGTRHESGSFCTECGTPRYNPGLVGADSASAADPSFAAPASAEGPDFAAPTPVATAPASPAAPGKAFSVSRSSTCAGDDCQAPHLFAVEVPAQATVRALLEQVADSIPSLRNVSWTILCGFDKIACLISGEDGSYQSIAIKPDDAAAALSSSQLFCQYHGEMQEQTLAGFRTTGMLAEGVTVGRVDFETEGVMAYALLRSSDDGEERGLFQISRADYKRLMAVARPGSVPEPPVDRAVIDSCKKVLLCEISADLAGGGFTLAGVDLALAELY